VTRWWRRRATRWRQRLRYLRTHGRGSARKPAQRQRTGARPTAATHLVVGTPRTRCGAHEMAARCSQQDASTPRVCPRNSETFALRPSGRSSLKRPWMPIPRRAAAHARPSESLSLRRGAKRRRS
jgi:hypothetical protein